MTEKKSDALEIPRPKRLSTQRNIDGLIEIKIKLRNRTMTVREANYLDGFKRGKLIGEARTSNEKSDSVLEPEESLAINLLMNIWAPLAACSSGDVPTKEEFLRLSEGDINFWVETAQELNPDWFSWLTKIDEVVEDESKKKEKNKSK